jgi:CarD family transcriptional regulator
MYPIGSKVVHPCYGAGIVVRIQEKSIGENSHFYYIIKTKSKSMQLMVPVQRAQSLGLRTVGDLQELRETLLDHCTTPCEDEINRDLRARQELMREQLKSGSYGEVASVVRILFFMNSQRSLGTIDRQLLDQGKELLASELALAADAEISEAMQEIESNLGRMLAKEQ